MGKPRWFQVLTEEDFDGYCQKHSCGLEKNIFRFESCDVVCQQGIDPRHIQPHVEVTTLFDVNAILLEQISKIFDCSQIQTYIMGKPRWFQVLTEEDFDGYCQEHSCGLRKNIFRFESCDVVCQQGIDPRHIQPHVKVTTMFDVNAIRLEQISKIFDCSQIQNNGFVGEEELIALRPWRGCESSKEGCKNYVHETSKFCSFTCKVEHVLEHEGDLSSIYTTWQHSDSSEHVVDLSNHPCGDPERIFPLKKRSRRRTEFYDSDEDPYGFRPHMRRGQS